MSFPCSSIGYRRPRKAGLFEETTDIACSSESDDNASTTPRKSSPSPLPPAKKAHHDHSIFNFSKSGNTSSSSHALAASPQKKQPQKSAIYDFTATGSWVEDVEGGSSLFDLREPQEQDREYSSLAAMYEHEYPDSEKVKQPRIRNLWV